MTGRAVRLLTWAAALALGSAGCGYKLAGSNTFLPPSIRIIALSPFDNRTSRPEIEQRVT